MDIVARREFVPRRRKTGEEQFFVCIEIHVSIMGNFLISFSTLTLTLTPHPTNTPAYLPNPYDPSAAQ
jgi:hypothetical protein